MLFSFYELAPYLNPYTVKGVIHVGAHVCEEINYYYMLGLKNENIFWVEGNPETFQLIKHRYPNFNIYQGLCTDKSGDNISFTITRNKNNGDSTDSSSIFKLGTHLQHHPFVVEDKTIEVKSTMLDHLLFSEPIQNVNMMNIDVQGAELLVLKGSEKILEQIKYIYVEINKEELYIGCALIEELDEYLKEKGFERVLTKWTEFQWGDALYVKSKL
jgi:FkbM family methyltransferase